MPINNKVIMILVFSFAIPMFYLLASEKNQMLLGGFSQQVKSLPESWMPLTFVSIEEYTSYTLVYDQNTSCNKS